LELCVSDGPTGDGKINPVASVNPPAVPDPSDPASPTAPAETPYWWEDPDLAAAVAEVEEFVGTAGWDAAPQMFALVRTADLTAAQPNLAAALADSGVFTPIAQEVLPAGDLSEALSTILWPAEVAGCVLVQEIVVIPPSADTTRPDAEITAEEAAAHPDRAEARLAAGVLRDGKGGACVLRVRGRDDTAPLRGGDLAPNLLGALHATFED
jgi:hypothetical protein